MEIQPDYSVMKAALIADCDRVIDLCNKALRGELKLSFTEKELKKDIAVKKRLKTILEKDGMNPVRVYSAYLRIYSRPFLSESNKLFYEKLHNADSIFRVNEFIELHSLKETLNFIESRENIEDEFRRVRFVDCTKEQAIAAIEKFWADYPNGMIKFG
jgi:hypothetical protein